MVEKLDGFDLKGDGGGKNDDGIGDDTLDWMRLLFGDIDDENNEIVLDTNQIIRETPKQSYEQNEMARKLMQLNPLGLQFSLPPTWMDSITNPNYVRTIEAGVSQASSGQSMDSSDFGQKSMSSRVKASNFAASFIKIGEWQRASKNEGDLMAKCYFIKKKLVWEFLQGRLKYKIEIQWSDISGINAVMEKNQPGILQIELNRPPTFHEEIDPQPRKQAIWKLAKDFTGRQASIFRMHYLTFPHKYLDKHYENLLLCETRFFELSKQSFPTLKNPFFRSNSCGNPGSAFDYNHRGQDFNLRMQFNFPNFPSHVGQTQHIQPYGHIGQTQHVQPYGHNDQAQHKQPYGHKGLSSLKEMPTPASDSCNVLENQRMSYWGQGMSIYTDALARNQGLVPSVQSTQVHPTVPFQNYNLANLGQEAVMNNNAAKALDVENQLLGDMQAGSYHEKYHMEMVGSLNKMVNLHKEVSPESKKASQETLYGKDISGEENFTFCIEENANLIGGQFYEQQKVTWMPRIHPANPNPTADKFGNVNNFNNYWS
ncbi:hypothetical protein POPTR_005G014600v4 [Populus trichocarpa]|uniref:TRF2/HOY1 PH-like domain-containing protein n=1 Tax=Populus trichocarpa TaxID=3694 RepID=A0A3N7G7N9_POPTR|nr:uncharacterized protein LOC112327581 isoform X1 [Populus trichocarpa]RQO89888.1 hypothetical protein POPTR_005G014600v4 [Populus trichocarpa]|eukprot:XP_024457210.1 uncharacterized protein LOC112327581 isoform X1 [Populus trichocarpa]